MKQKSFRRKSTITHTMTDANYMRRKMCIGKSAQRILWARLWWWRYFDVFGNDFVAWVQAHHQLAKKTLSFSWDIRQHRMPRKIIRTPVLILLCVLLIILYNECSFIAFFWFRRLLFVAVQKTGILSLVTTVESSSSSWGLLLSLHTSNSCVYYYLLLS